MVIYQFVEAQFVEVAVLTLRAHLGPALLVVAVAIYLAEIWWTSRADTATGEIVARRFRNEALDQESECHGGEISTGETATSGGESGFDGPGGFGLF